ncbi:MAG: hypothetical protein NVV70_17740 [Cellulomonas sp.]|nr:hypothetical protein [Cellulomonas sp.]MCR6649882.1 hypothetical protein [Cellulomonas sp.]
MPGRASHAHRGVGPQLAQPGQHDERARTEQQAQERGLGVERTQGLPAQSLRVDGGPEREPRPDHERGHPHACARPAEPPEQRGAPLAEREHHTQRGTHDDRRDRPRDIDLPRAGERRDGDGLDGRERGRREEGHREHVEPRRPREPSRGVEHRDALGGCRVLRREPTPPATDARRGQRHQHRPQVAEAVPAGPRAVVGGARARGARTPDARARCGEVGVVLA